MADVKISALSAASTLDGTEVAPIVQSAATVKVTTQAIANLGVKTIKATLSSANILALFGTPITLVAAPGAGKIINLINVTASLVFNTTPYATNTALQFSVGSWGGMVTFSGFLANSSNQITESPVTSVASAATANVDNRSLRVICPSGNPTAGDSTVDIYITYNIITL